MGMLQRIQTLTRVAEVRAIEEEDKVVEVRKARIVLEEQEEQLARVDRSITDIMTRLYKAQTASTLDVEELGMMYEYRESLDKRRKAQLKSIEAARASLDSKLEELLEAHRERRVIETYRDKLKIEHLRVEDQEEQKRMDAMFVSRRALG